MRTAVFFGLVAIAGCQQAAPAAAPAPPPSSPSRAVSRPAPPFEIVSVEPPSWWAHHSIDPVRLLVRGRGLSGALLEVDGGVSVSRVSVNPAGTALFADVAIGDARPGRHRLRVVKAGSAVERAWEVLPPVERRGRFAGFSPDDVVYLLMPDRFADGDRSNDDPEVSRGLYDRARGRYYHGGDFQGVIDRLPYLKDLGVTAIWMTPIYDNSNRLNEREKYDGQAVTDFHGYGAVDYYGVEEHFGDLAKLRELVDRAHAAGIKVIQDQVTNHVGPEHPWANDPPTPDWLHGTPEHHLMIQYDAHAVADPNGDAAEKKRVLDGWFVNLLPDVAQESEEAARYETQNTLWWIGIAGFDGVRQDTLPYVPRAFWSRWTKAIRREFPDVRVVGEANDKDPKLVSFFQGGKARFDGVDSGIDTVFDFPLVYPLRRVFAEGRPMKELAKALEEDVLYVDPSVLVTFAGLHDMKRFMNEPGATTKGLALAQTFLLTARGTPMIYYGDEIGMPGGDDPDNRRDFPGGFPGDARDAFTDAGRAPEEQALFTHVRKVIRVRKDLEPLRRGRMIVLAAGERTIAYARVVVAPAPAPGVIVVINAGDAPESVTFDASRAQLAPGSALVDRLQSAPDVRLTGATLTVRLPAKTAAIYAPK